ncbi:MAG: MBL fold metallo-hydrolase [Patescibacteria group bacterium]
MDIQWHGLSCFTIKGKNATIVTDPYDAKEVGLKPLKLSADIVLSNADFTLHHNVADFKGATILDWPGEYEAKGVIIQGVAAFDRPRDKEDPKKDNGERVIIYALQVDGFKLCHLSNLGHKLTNEMQEAIGDVDILFVPIGGGVGLDAKKAHEVIEQLDPRIVIPMYYNIPGIKLPLAELSAFTKEVGIQSPAAEKILKFATTSGLPQEHTEFKILEPTLD